MGKTKAIRLLSVVVATLLLLGYSPVVTAGLLCVGDEAANDCCDDDDRSAGELLADSGCGCCVAVATASSGAGASVDAPPLEIRPGTVVPAPAHAAAPRGAQNDVAPTARSSLRTVVLLI